MDSAKFDFEKRRVFVDLHKALATWSSGAVALTAAFTSFVEVFGFSAITLGVAVFAFFVCIICSVYSCFSLVISIDDTSFVSEKVQTDYIYTGTISLFAFMGGITGLLATIVVNIMLSL